MRLVLISIVLVGITAGAAPRDDAGYVVIMDRAPALAAIQGLCRAAGLWWEVAEDGVEVGNRRDARPTELVRHYRVSAAFAQVADNYDGTTDGKATQADAFVRMIGFDCEGYVIPEAHFSIDVERRLLRCQGSRQAQQRLSWTILRFDPEAPNQLSQSTHFAQRWIAEEDLAMVQMLRQARLAEFAVAGDSVRSASARLERAIAAVAPQTFRIRLHWQEQAPSVRFRWIPHAAATPEQLAQSKAYFAKFPKDAEPQDPFANGLAPFGETIADGSVEIVDVLHDGTPDGRFRSEWAWDVDLWFEAKTPRDFVVQLGRTVGSRCRIFNDTVFVLPWGTSCRMGRQHDPVWVNDRFVRVLGASSNEEAIRRFFEQRGLVYDDGDFLRYLPELKVLVFYMHLAKLEQVHAILKQAGALAKPAARPHSWPAAWSETTLPPYPEKASMAAASWYLRRELQRSQPDAPVQLVWTWGSP